ncbi:MAG: ATP-binding protein, partial [Methanobacteriaceae archaeon]|nr:ATP-binding protein [Methanobacteriaceae archaeon]
DNLLKIEENEILSEEIELIKEVITEDSEAKIFIETTKRLSQYKNLEENKINNENFENIEIKTPNKGGEFLRENLESILDAIGSNKYDNEELSEIYETLAILKIKKSSQEEDKLLIQAINSVDDLDESISKLIERIRDWYTVYFPEMDTITNNETYIKMIAECENREDIINNYPEHFKSTFSAGADIEDEDILMLKSFASSLYALQKSRAELEDYIDKKMEAIAPNLRDLLGSSLGAKLIAHIGSIKQLATYPASVIQIMGAEKAIFRHLKTGERPPKHGLIFQHPEVRGAKWWNRGKVARTLALKITLAVRKDVFSGEYDPNIARDFLEKVERIEKENPFPKKTKQRRTKERENEKANRKGKPKKYKGNKKNKKNKKKRRK